MLLVNLYVLLIILYTQEYMTTPANNLLLLPSHRNDPPTFRASDLLILYKVINQSKFKPANGIHHSKKRASVHKRSVEAVAHLSLEEVEDREVERHKPQVEEEEELDRLQVPKHTRLAAVAPFHRAQAASSSALVAADSPPPAAFPSLPP